MVLFVLYVVLTFESVYEIMWCDHSNESSLAVLSHVAWDQAGSGRKRQKTGSNAKNMGGMEVK